MFLPEGGRRRARCRSQKFLAGNRRRPGPWLNAGLPVRIC